MRYQVWVGILCGSTRSSRARFNSVGSKCLKSKSLSLRYSWLPCLECESYRWMCWLSCSDGNGGPAERLYYCAYCFCRSWRLSLTWFLSIPVRRVFCAVGMIVRNFLLLSDSAGEFNCGQLLLFCTTVFQGMGPLLFHRSVFLTVCTMGSSNFRLGIQRGACDLFYIICF